MDWTEVSPGVYSKELCGVEKIYRNISQLFKPVGREHWGLYCVCDFELGPSLSGKDPAAVLRDAWKALRYDFPALAVAPDGLTKKTYILPNQSSVEKWADETFIVDPISSSDDILASYPPRDTPTIHYLPELSQVVFLCSHWRIDGLGTCMIMDRFFTILAKATGAPTSKSWANDLHKISPNLEEALGVPATETPEVQALAREHIKEHHKNAVHAGGLPYLGDAKTPPGRPAATATTFNEDSTAAFIATCKARKVTVTSAIYAALAGAIPVLSLDECTKKYAAVMAVNMRNHLQEPYNGRDHPVQVYVVGQAPTVDHSSSFYEKTKEFSNQTGSWYNEDFKRAYRVATQYQYEALCNRGPPPKPPSSVTLSSLGVIERNLSGEYGGGAVKVRDFRFGVSMMTRQMLLYAWTFGGKLQFSVNYNDAYHDSLEVAAFLELIVQILKKEMGVTLVAE
ncbi:uncharacterized protein F4822DRAFT_323318 [Hypoxylon trugodes]|uniref:uncharacterized protein n=1 Tax=Hypoxylon trugodes TaxID=326681 RepID=UPI0021A18BC4|nr:uncharacterized protein F4822DRAFT_323318 [Hypoxylon trugodes]KAI1386657.1 hypothetical protein F4822DRAFT_323318 [Hypoxylon trugodes]